jgi:hypothetical protein
MTSRGDSSDKDGPVFAFFGTVDGALGQITIAQPLQRGPHEWTAHLTMSGCFSANADVTGVSEDQAIELAFGICHAHVGKRCLRDNAGKVVFLPGNPPDPTDRNDLRRAEIGLAVCLVDEENGDLRLVLDDVTHDGSAWKDLSFYTHKRYPKKKLLQFGLSEQELAEIGFAVIARLVAGRPPGRS